MTGTSTGISTGVSTETGAFQRAVRRARQRRLQAVEADLEHCDICGQVVDNRHRHLLDTERREVMCACRPCALLFNLDAASQGHYRLVPERRLRLTPVSTKRLGVPVGLAFFVGHDDGSVSAHYPSPAGATAWEIDQQDWRQTVAESPALEGLAPEVEAFLVNSAQANTARGRLDQWIVPIDDCFRLVAIVRENWQGLSGGNQVWPRIDDFFESLAGRPASNS